MEREPEWNLPWQYDSEGSYLNLKTELGVFELRPYDTYIFEPVDIKHRRLRHIYHIIDDSSEEVYNGFYLFRERCDQAGWDYDNLVYELTEHGFHTEHFDDPEPSDIRAWEREHEEKYYPETLEQIMDKHDSNSVFEAIVESAMRNFDPAWEWYSEEWR